MHSDGNNNARLRFVKENRSGRRVACAKIDICAENLFRIKTAFGQGDPEAAFGAIMRILDKTFAN